MSAAADYYENVQELLVRLRANQLPGITRAAEHCAERISRGGLIFLFGAGHSRMMCEMAPCQGFQLLQRGLQPVMLPSHQFTGTPTAHAAEEQLEPYYEGYPRSVAHL